MVLVDIVVEVATPNMVLVDIVVEVASPNMVLVDIVVEVATSDMVLVDIVVDTCSICLRWWMHHSYTLLDDLEERSGAARKIY